MKTHEESKSVSPSPAPITDREMRRLANKELERLQAHQKDCAKTYTGHAMYIAMGSFAVAGLFYEKFKIPHETMLYLFIAMALFLATIILTLFSYYASMQSAVDYEAQLRAEWEKSRSIPSYNSKWDTIRKICNLCAAIIFIIATSLMLLISLYLGVHI